jgi:hypothetical protein
VPKLDLKNDDVSGGWEYSNNVEQGNYPGTNKAWNNPSSNRGAQLSNEWSSP